MTSGPTPTSTPASTAPPTATASATTAELLSLTRVSGDAGYNAFTDLAFYAGYFWLAYRTGARHVSPHGRVVVQRSRDGLAWEAVATIAREGLDLRDPRLAVVGGRLVLLAFSLRYYKTRPMRFEGGDSFFYRWDGNAFELAGTFPFAEHDQVLWALTEVAGTILVSGYKFPLGHFRMSVWRAARLAGPWTRLWTAPENEIPPNMGFTEADFVRAGGPYSAPPRERLALLCRVDGDSFHRVRGVRQKFRARRAYKTRKRAATLPPDPGFKDWTIVATAAPPFNQWTLQVHRLYLKGPRAIFLPGRAAGLLVVGRYQAAPRAPKQVQLFHYTAGEGFRPLLALAEGKDGSYAGLCWDPGRPRELLVSFYSDHARVGTAVEGKQNDVWVARVAIREGDGDSSPR